MQDQTIAQMAANRVLPDPLVALAGELDSDFSTYNKDGAVIWILAGEPSADAIGARLIQALSERDPTLIFAGVGGTQMAALGLRSLFPMADLSVMGFWDVVFHYFHLRQRLFECVQDIILSHPEIVITIDHPVFSGKLMHRVSHMETRRVQYVAPQVWAWGPKRIVNYRHRWDRLLCLLPCEVPWFLNAGVKTSFVGHPALQSASGPAGKACRFRHQHNISDNAKILLLLPGSRKTEIKTLMPIYEKTVDLLTKEFPDLRPAILVGQNVKKMIERKSKHWKNKPVLVIGKMGKQDAFASCTCALTKSGTSTIELAAHNIPMVVAHKVGPIFGMLARYFITVPYICMLNILANAEIVPEFIQGRCKPNLLAYTLSELLRNPAERKKQLAFFPDILNELKPEDPSKTPAGAAADEILELLHTPIEQVEAERL
ncbi:lipid-A-disaccharide synthase [Acetobacteraceae bacterium]|nr:lipid-A-disaccharide synthase [Acetobacteraceae bacterium]